MKRENFRKRKKFFFIIAGLIISLNFIYANSENKDIYRLKLNFKVGSWGKLIFVIPYRAYGEVNADIYLKRHKLKDNEYLFKFYKIASPAYYVQTIDFIPKEIHIRVADLNIRRGYLYGEQKLKEICLKNSLYCKTVIRKHRKSLPFLYFKTDENIFNFRTNKEGDIQEQSIKNRIKMFYAWPSTSDFGIPSYNMLAASLCFLNIPYKISDSKKQEYRILNINLNRCLNKVLYQAIPTIRKFVKLRQKRLFHLYFKKINNGDKTTYKGVATPDVKVWGNFHITKVKREVKFIKDKIILNRFYIEVYDKNGKGGSGEVILKKVN